MECLEGYVRGRLEEWHFDGRHRGGKPELNLVAPADSVRLKKGCMWITLNHAADDMAVRFLRTDGWKIVP